MQPNYYACREPEAGLLVPLDEEKSRERERKSRIRSLGLRKEQRKGTKEPDSSPWMKKRAEKGNERAGFVSLDEEKSR
ncbi:hypothetical protein, partial [Cytobacillus oceanisediminis]|uniref:hypothetical protein n=1 Tax=Cytobacillus oceanisediminis TaxID=665099 RepID=UPI003736DFAE